MASDGASGGGWDVGVDIGGTFTDVVARKAVKIVTDSVVLVKEDAEKKAEKPAKKTAKKAEPKE